MSKRVFCMQKSTSFDKARHWLLESGIQGENGAFSAWFDKGTAKHSFEYSEITGYGITALVYLSRVSEEKAALEKASKAMAWLEERAIVEGGVLTRNYRDWENGNEKFSFEGGNMLAFDTGMVLNGLVALYDETKDEKSLELAKCSAGFLLDRMFDGRKMHAVYSSREGKVEKAGDRWSTQPGSYHAKVAIGLLGLAGMTGEKKYEEAAVSLCDFALTKQAAEGRFVTNDTNNSTHLHPHCYSCEGLLFAGKKLSREDYVRAAEKAVEWAFDNQAEDGGVKPFFDGSWNENQRSDVLAQVLRLASALKSMNLLQKVSSEKVAELEKRLLCFQDESGGFLYGKELEGQERNCVNAWCTMFAMQALSWKNRSRVMLEELI